MEELNGKQNERIASLESNVKNLDRTVNTFIENHFEHFKIDIYKKISNIFGLVVLGILIPIVLFIIQLLIIMVEIVDLVQMGVRLQEVLLVQYLI